MEKDIPQVPHIDQQVGQIDQLEKLRQDAQKIVELVEYIGGPEASIDAVLPLPPEIRQDAAEPNWSNEQKAVVRAVANELGFGSEQDVSSGLSGASVVLEGGLAWKVQAELLATTNEDSYSSQVFAGSPNRKLRDDEITFLSVRGIVLSSEASEYDMVAAVAMNQEGFEALDQAEIEPFSYETDEGNTPGTTTSGQLVKIGTVDGRQVRVLRVDREDFEDEDGNNKYRNQPNSEQVIRLMADYLQNSDDTDTPVELKTSNAYASRVPASLAAAEGLDRRVGIGMYGRATMATVKGEEIAPESPLNQLPGDLRLYLENAAKVLSSAE